MHRPLNTFLQGIIFFSLFGFVFIAASQSGQNQDSRTRAQSRTSLTTIRSSPTPAFSYNTQLLSLNAQYIENGKTMPSTAPAQQRLITQMQTVAASRKTELYKLLETKVSDYMKNATLFTQRSTFPPEIQPLLEQKVTWTGKIKVIIEDHFNTKITDTKYSFEKSPTVSYAVYFTALPQTKIEPDSHVEITGVVLGNKIGLYDRDYVFKSLPVLTSFSGPRTVLVIMVNFLNNRYQDISPKQVYDLMFNNPQNVADFYQTTTYDSVSLTGTVAGWYTINHNLTSCDLETWKNEALDLARKDGKNPDSYDHVMIAVANQNNCDGSGYGEMPGRITWIMQGSLIWNTAYSHELGHNLGLHHANFLECGAKSIDFPSNCQSQEYNDPSDSMGVVYNLFNGPHRYELGRNSVQFISTDGIYTVPVLNASGQKLLYVSRNNGEYYFLSYRKPMDGFDTLLPSGFLNGVSIHLWNTIPHTQTNLIDTKPQTDIISDAPLSDGATFDDQISKIKIKQLSHTNDFATVEVDFYAVPTPPAAVSNATWGGYTSGGCTNFQIPLIWSPVTNATSYSIKIDNQGTAIPTPPMQSVQVDCQRPSYGDFCISNIAPTPVNGQIFYQPSILLPRDYPTFYRYRYSVQAHNQYGSSPVTQSDYLIDASTQICPTVTPTTIPTRTPTPAVCPRCPSACPVGTTCSCGRCIGPTGIEQ